MHSAPGLLLGLNPMIATTAILIATYVAIMTERMNRSIVALLGAGVMIVGGLVAAFIGVAAEGKSLEDVATPFAARRGSVRAEGSASPRYQS